jgi:hypothetical protein
MSCGVYRHIISRAALRAIEAMVLKVSIYSINSYING